MKLEGAQTIAADRMTVWAALNDPDVLKACIPGCQSLERAEDGAEGFDAVVKQKVGPVSATFRGSIRLEDLNPPESYRISGEGRGGAAGFAKGDATVRLEEVAGGTELRYSADAKVGGKLAQLGGRVVDAFARKTADEFFARFKSEVEGPAAADAEMARRQDAGGGAASAASAGAPPGAVQRPIQTEWAAGAARSEEAAGSTPARPPHQAPAEAAAGKAGTASQTEAAGAKGGRKKSFWKRLFG